MKEKCNVGNNVPKDKDFANTQKDKILDTIVGPVVQSDAFCTLVLFFHINQTRLFGVLDVRKGGSLVVFKLSHGLRR